MNTEVENRLRAALSARADQVNHESLRPPSPPVPSRRPNLRLLTFALPVTAAAAVAALMVTSNLTPPADQRSLPAARTGPQASSRPSVPAPGNPGQTQAAEPGGRDGGADPDHPATGTRPGPGAGESRGDRDGESTGRVTVDPATVSIDLPAYPSLRPGDRGPAVRVLQKLLNQRNYRAGPLDGVYGEVTADAVRRFQEVRRLPKHPGFGPTHWASLLSTGGRPSLAAGATGEDVRRLQRALTAALERTVTIDGQYGQRTVAAVKEYQERIKFPPTGEVDAVLWASLAGRTVQPPADDPEPTPPADQVPPVANPSVAKPSEANRSDAFRAATRIGSQTGENGGA
jgi:peptidoglycan hydrolase-like protein with peptidoglycan-binding domain